MPPDFDDTKPVETASASWDGAEFSSGEVIAGRYKVLSLLGKGGMGLVYRVEQLIGGKELALKTIHQSFLSETTVKRFEHEARATFAVSHANIIAVKAFGLLDERTPFLAMEIVEGQTLAELLQDSGPLPIEAALPILIQVCHGLAHAHENAVVHRDIKPSNIMILKGRPIGSEGSIKILDFGIAKFSHREGGEIQCLTKTGEIFGSPLYMSPEQCNGDKVDQRSDIYSLGCVIFEILTGRAPFVGRNAMATLMMHLTDTPPSLSETAQSADFPAVLEQIVAKMLAKQPEDRYQDLDLVAHDLDSIINRRDPAELSQSIANSVAEQSSSLRIQPHNKRNIFLAIAAIAILPIVAVATILQPPKEKTKVEVESAADLKKGREELEIARTADEKKVDRTAELNEVDPSQLKAELSASGTTFGLKNHLVTAKMLEIIGSTKHIKNINLLGCKIDNDNLDKLAKLPLTNITLTNTNFDDSGAKKLAQVQSLCVIKANYTQISNRGLAYLKQLPRLTHLKIEGTKIDIDGARNICKKTTLKQLALASCHKITEADRKQLVKEFPKIDLILKGEYEFND